MISESLVAVEAQKASLTQGMRDRAVTAVVTAKDVLWNRLSSIGGAVGQRFSNAVADAAYVFAREKSLLAARTKPPAAPPRGEFAGVVIGETVRPLFTGAFGSGAEGNLTLDDRGLTLERGGKVTRLHSNERVRVGDCEGILKLFAREYRVEVEQ